MKNNLLTKNTKAIFYNQHPKPIQRMIDYDWLVKKDAPSVVAIVNPRKAGFHRAFWGQEEISIPVYKTVTEAAQAHQDADLLINFASERSAFEPSKEALEIGTVKTVMITAEGIPENETRELIRIAKENKKWIIGPTTVGAIKPGVFKIANTGGTIENIMESKLHRAGSIAVTMISGGLSNEIYNICSKYADGVYEGIAVGGDSFLGSTLLDNMLRFEADPNAKMHVVVSEVGGTDEYEIVEAIKNRKLKKPVVAWVAGTVAKSFGSEVQFGHAGAKSGSDDESAQAKNKALKEAGAYVPESFNSLGATIKDVFEKHIASAKDYQKPIEDNYRMPPMDFEEASSSSKIRKNKSITSSISDDRGEEATYNKQLISSYAEKSIGSVINALWFKGKLNKTGEEFIELAIKLSADHGPAVSTAHNAIVTSRAGNNIVSSLIAGLTTIGDRHGGAIDGAATWALECISEEISAQELIVNKKKSGQLIMGIGHKIKSVQNPDTRVTLLKNFAKENLNQTKYLDFALEVEVETTKKKNNLILNVDGAIGTVFLDILAEAGYSEDEIAQLISIGVLNSIFVLARSIGMIGHALDQKRMGEGLYRHSWDDIYYQ